MSYKLITFVQKFEACYRKIFEIDETLQQLGSMINYDKIYFIIIGAMIVWYISNVSTCIVVFFIMWVQTDVYRTIGTTVSYLYALSVNSIIILEFYILVKYVKIGFI